MQKITRKNARRIEYTGTKLDDCVKFLLEYKDRGESVVVNFEGHDLYSCDVTIDNAYMEITGKTKEEFYKQIEEENAIYEKIKEQRKIDAENTLKELIKKGEQLVYPERLEEWKRYVQAKMKNGTPDLDLKHVIKIMEILESGATPKEANEILKQHNNSGFFDMFVKKAVFTFSKKGPEFLEYTMNGNISDENRKIIEERKRENEEFEKLYKQDFNDEKRKEEELEIIQKLKQKRQLTQEISDIEKQQRDLEDKEKEIKRNSSNNEFIKDDDMR